MFVYNFKENKLPNISNLKANINTELFILENQINTTDKINGSIVLILLIAFLSYMLYRI